LTKQALEYSLIENLQRKDVDPLDIAKALKKLYDMRSVQPLNSSKRTHKEYTIRQFCEEISSTLGLSYVEVWNYLSLLNLIPEVQEMISEDKLGVKLASQKLSF
jgi:ParB-like chromosome segregation protein Spo0J